MPTDLTQVSPEKIIRLLQHGNRSTRREVYAEISRRLSLNKTNWHFFRLVAGVRLRDEPLAADAYHNLRRMVCRYLTDYHRPDLKVAWTPGRLPLKSDWNWLFHETLFGDGLDKHGEIDRYLDITWELHLLNALYNRYSGILTRTGQRRKDQWRRRKRENTWYRIEKTQHGPRIVPAEDTEEGEPEQDFPLFDAEEAWRQKAWDGAGQGEHIIGLDETGQPIYDSISFEETLEAPTRDEFDTIDLIRWTENGGIRAIHREAGSTAMWTWVILLRSLNDGFDITKLRLPEVRKQMVAALSEQEGIERKAAEKRLRQLAKSDSLREFVWRLAVMEEGQRARAKSNAKNKGKGLLCRDAPQATR